MVLRFQTASGHQRPGELLAFQITPANTDDRAPVPKLARGLVGKLFGDKGYISKKLFETLMEQGLQLITRVRKNMKNQLLPLEDKLLLRKRALIETVNDQLKISHRLSIPGIAASPTSWSI
nr:transposase [Thiothrix nivea]